MYFFIYNKILFNRFTFNNLSSGKTKMNINAKPNKLINELSPYLLQHAHNPVDWYPWGEDAFAKANEEDKPIFLSIGYSTCHWCHVMAHESFGDENIASLMNDVFINIKVDREERPDIDSVYMQVCQMLNGNGGWPLTIIMTPDKKPFFAGTYFPKESKWGRIGMKELILRISELWKGSREEIISSANGIVANLNYANDIKSDNSLNRVAFDKAFNELSFSYDSLYGGFGGKPKFPMPVNIMFLLRFWKRFNRTDVPDMIRKTLEKMKSGGIYDHLGYGFHRYSTDEKWLVPHFEKMLYDQALLMAAYTKSFHSMKNDEYKDTVNELYEYINRDMTSTEGAFYSAEDADSEGTEGKFYVWDIDEIKSVLGNDSDLFITVFNVSENGNFYTETNEGGKAYNILHVNRQLNEIAKEEGMALNELKLKINELRQKLFLKRKNRIHPFKDDKILTDWNSLMIASLANAAIVFHNDKYLDKAEMAARFILNQMLMPDGKLLHMYRNGKAGTKANLDDYVFFVNALIELYLSSFNIEYLEKAIEINNTCINDFWSDENNCFSFTSKDKETLFVKRIELFDGAVPSGNSIAVMNLVRLGRITGDTGLINRAERMIKAYSNSVNKSPSAFCGFLCSFDELINESMEIIIVGDELDYRTKELLEKSREFYKPGKIIIQKNSDFEIIDKISVMAKDKKMINKSPTAYVCRNNTCLEPVNTSVDLLKLLNGK